MTLAQARWHVWSLIRNTATVERAEVVPESEGSYSVRLVRVNGTEQTIRDEEEAIWAGLQQQKQEMLEGDLYVTLNDEGVPVPCDFKTNIEWRSKNLARLQTKITCSPDVEATITFTGHCPASFSMDGPPRFWALTFYSAERNTHYGFGPGIFETREQAEACVSFYVESGCPAPSTMEWWKAQAAFSR
jgi:hypothetical protein